MAIAEAPTFEDADWATVREACPVLIRHLGLTPELPPPVSAAPDPPADLSAPPNVPLVIAVGPAGTARVPEAPFSAPPSSLLSLEMPQSSWGLGLGPQFVAPPRDIPLAGAILDPAQDPPPPVLPALVAPDVLPAWASVPFEVTLRRVEDQRTELDRL